MQFFGLKNQFVLADIIFKERIRLESEANRLNFSQSRGMTLNLNLPILPLPNGALVERAFESLCELFKSCDIRNHSQIQTLFKTNANGDMISSELQYK
jgi:hypothetical protein